MTITIGLYSLVLVLFLIARYHSDTSRIVHVKPVYCLWWRIGRRLAHECYYGLYAFAFRIWDPFSLLVAIFIYTSKRNCFFLNYIPKFRKITQAFEASASNYVILRFSHNLEVLNVSEGRTKTFFKGLMQQSRIKSWEGSRCQVIYYSYSNRMRK